MAVKKLIKINKMKKACQKKKLQEFIDSIAIVGESTIPNDDGKIYYSKIDGSYLTRVGLENNLKYLLERGITEQIQSWDLESEKINSACIGFSPKEQKWYGWSHRSIYGFGIGSECKKGHIHFKASNKEEFKESCLSFWRDDEYSKGDEKIEFTKGKDWNGNIANGVQLTYTYNDKVPNKKLRNTIYTHFSPFPETWGRGEWTAKTLEDAKEMAIDFAKGIT